MACAASIIRDLSSAKISGISIVLKKFLEPVFKNDDSLGYQETKGYTNFAVNFLHHSVLKLKSTTNTAAVLELLSAAVQCCECYRQTWEPASVTDDAYKVPKLIYHILNILRHEDYAEQIVELSGLVYDILLCCPQPISSDGQTIVTALFACVWNTTNKLSPEKENKISLEMTLKLRRCSLMFTSLQSDHDKLLEMLKRTICQFAQYSDRSSESDTLCCEIMQKTFEDLISRLTWKFELETDDVGKLEICICELQLKSLFVEHLFKINDYNRARQAAQGIEMAGLAEAVPEHVVFLCKCVAHMYEIAICVQGLGENGKTVAATDCEIPEFLNPDKLEEYLDCYSAKELLPLYNGCNFLTQLISNKNVITSKLPSTIIAPLITCLDIFIAVASKLLTVIPSSKKKSKTDSKTSKNENNTSDLGSTKCDESTKTYVTLLNGCYRKLLLVWQHLQGVDRTDPSHSTLLESARSSVLEFQNVLDATESVSTSEKSKHTYRYNCGYVSSLLGKYCLRQGLYDTAAMFYTVSIHHLNICQQPNLMKLFESLVECHKKQGQWNDAVKVVIQSFATMKDHVTSVAAMWAQLKREALASEQTWFLKLTLMSVVKEAMKAKPDHSTPDKDVLLAEYSAWKRFSRRNYSVEFYILKELLGVKLDTEDKAAALIDMATNMCITGLVYKDSSAGDLLTSSILLLDKAPATQCGQALLALAYYTKYIVVHEQVMQDLQTSTDISKPDVPSEKGDNSDQSDSQTSQYTLQSETTYSPFLYKALELWEKSLGRKCSDVNIDVGRHVEALVSCGTRLMTMRKPLQAMKALQLAQHQIGTLSDPKLAQRVRDIQAKVLLFLGRYDQADSVVGEAGDAGGETAQLLLQAEICLFIGKKQQGLELLNQVLHNRTSNTDNKVPMSRKVCMTDGTAKRLLSMLLCFPDHNSTNVSNHYPLTLASEAVRCHVSVLRTLTNVESLDKNTGLNTVDKWTFLHEVLQSLHHMVQLYRLTGLARLATSFLLEGLKISQSQGLPRWTCEFLFERLRIQSMEADNQGAIATIDRINSILMDSSDESKELNKPEEIDVPCSNKSKSVTNSDVFKKTECFGFDGSSGSKKALSITDEDNNGSPDKKLESNNIEITSEKKRQLSKVVECMCMSESRKCDDIVRHRLCLEAGVVMSDFLSQSELRNVANELLTDAETKFIPSVMSNGNRAVCFSEFLVAQESNDRSLPGLENGNGLHYDPRVKYVGLEASCLLAEKYLQLKDFENVHQIWQKLREFEKSGHMSNILHGNILMARLALCEASAFLFSNEFLSEKPVADVGNGNSVAVLAASMGDLTLDKKKGVRFNKEDEVLIVEGKKLKGARRNIMSNKENVSDGENSGKKNLETVFKTPKKRSVRKEIMTTPLVPVSARKINRLALQTPLSSRMAALDFFMANSDDEEDAIMFPVVKPVTPQVAKPRKTKGIKCKADPRKSKSDDTILANANEGPVCAITKVSDRSSEIQCEGQVIVKKSVDKPAIIKRGRKNATSTAENTKVDKDVCTNLEKDLKAMSISTNEQSSAVSKDSEPDYPKKKLQIDLMLDSPEPGSDEETADDTKSSTRKETKCDLNCKKVSVTNSIRKKHLLNSAGNDSNKAMDKTCIDNSGVYDFDTEASPSVGMGGRGRGRGAKRSVARGRGAGRGATKTSAKGKTQGNVTKLEEDIKNGIINHRNKGVGLVAVGETISANTKKETVCNEDIGDGDKIVDEHHESETHTVGTTSRTNRAATGSRKGGASKTVAKSETSTRGRKKGRAKENSNEDIEIGRSAKKSLSNDVTASLDHKAETNTRATRCGRGKKKVIENIEIGRSMEKEITKDVNISFDKVQFSDEAENSIHETEHFDAGVGILPLDSECNDQNHCLPIFATCDLADCDIKMPVLKNSPNELKCLDSNEVDFITKPIVNIQPIVKNLTWNYCEPQPIQMNVTSSSEDKFEEIEIMRGDTKQKKGAKSKGKQNATKSVTVDKKVTKSSESDADSSLVEVVRSSRNLSLRDSCLLEEIRATPVAVAAVNSRPTATVGPDQATIIAALESVYDSIRQLPSCPRHADVCKMLALHYVDTNPRRAAFLLTDSHAVTFRHQAMLNMDRKVRKQEEEHNLLEGQQGSLQLHSSDNITDGHLFNRDERSLQEMVDAIPQEWVVLQVSAINQGTHAQQLIMTRSVKEQSPLILRLPAFSSPQGRHILNDFTSIVVKNEEGMKITKKSDWWRIRMELDSDMASLVENMETFWLGQWRGAFRPRCIGDDTICRVGQVVTKVLKTEVDRSIVEVLLLSVPVLSDLALQRCASELLGSRHSQSNMEKVISIIRKHAPTATEPKSSCHVILILDKTVQHLPWESIPVLQSTSVSRMPCMSHLYSQLTYLQTEESSVYARGANPDKTYYIVNPDDNLTNTEKVFKDWFESMPGWQGIVGVPPTPEQFAQGITDYDLLIYCGHGTGGKYLSGDDIAKLKGQAAIILMGCSSGKLKVKGQLEASGMMINYLLAGCPCMIANLWDVTDRDTDRFLEHLLKSWFAADSSVPLSKVVQESRKICKTRINGCAPVVYGLPVYLKKK